MHVCGLEEKLENAKSTRVKISHSPTTQGKHCCYISFRTFQCTNTQIT